MGRIHVHFTPTSGSWLNLVEVWFGIIERQAIHRGTEVATLLSIQRHEGTVRMRPARVHFAAPGVCELLLDEPQACPTFEGLIFEGLAARSA